MRHFLIAIAIVIAFEATARAQILKREPPAGQLPAGVTVLVDDGRCPKGQIKEVTGGGNMGGSSYVSGGTQGASRTRRCIRR
ncbi:MAG: hypothetical protein M9883_14295 [Methylobacteriaceae bacterium]|nr:hypothetical protein [Methylobacteriaceae bacterium]MCC2102130.1 hypothetical protein [Hyphomicrobiales bacterium]MCO5088020.1 hypothetical protein [Methylobacteriaceae bacterium]